MGKKHIFSRNLEREDWRVIKNVMGEWIELSYEEVSWKVCVREEYGNFHPLRNF